MKLVYAEKLLSEFEGLSTTGYGLIDCFGAQADEEVAVYYLFSNYKAQCGIFAKTENLKLQSATTFFQNANWYEREIFERFGVAFVGHPDLRPLMSANR